MLRSRSDEESKRKDPLSVWMTGTGRRRCLQENSLVILMKDESEHARTPLRSPSPWLGCDPNEPAWFVLLSLGGDDKPGSVWFMV